MITIEERRERRTRLVEALRATGPDGAQGVALLQGAPKESIHGVFRQHNDFMYLCGVETPHAYLAVDARDASTHLFLPYQPPERREREGPLVNAADREAALAATGVDAVHGVEELAPFLERVRQVWTPMRAGEGAVQSWDTLQRAAQERAHKVRARQLRDSQVRAVQVPVRLVALLPINERCSWVRAGCVSGGCGE